MTDPHKEHLTWFEPADPLGSGDTIGMLTNDAGDLPEVAVARGRGFDGRPLETPLWDFIWILWPRSHRAWVADRRVRFGWSYRHDDDGEPGPGERVMWPAAEYAEIETSANGRLADLGLSARPPGRIWLLRPPSRFADLDAAFAHLTRLTDARKIRETRWPALLQPMQDVVIEIFDGDEEASW